MDDLLDRLDADQRELLRGCGRMATARGGRAYLVGGSVRDLVLERDHDDIDVVVVGDGMGVAQDLARSVDGTLTRHHAFQTATVDAAGLRVDVATARREDYPKPGRLPQVVAGDLDEDLERRDFTINTMAVSLAETELGRFVDPYDGLGDLRAGVIRVMHSRSFADDPTRILRALRFSLRFGYDLDAETGAWLAQAVRGGYLDTVSGERVRKELGLMLAEAPVEGPRRLAAEGALAAVHPRLEVDEEALGRLGELQSWWRAQAESADEPADGWEVVLACLATPLSPQERWDLARRVRLSAEERRPLIDAGAGWRKAEAALAAAGPEPANSVVERALRGLDTGALLAVAASGGPAASIRRHLLDLRAVRPELAGEDLKELGIEEGPRLGEILQRLRAAKLDGLAETAAEERALVAAWLAEKPL